MCVCVCVAVVAVARVNRVVLCVLLVPTSVPRPVYVLSCMWDDAYKRTLAANRKE